MEKKSKEKNQKPPVLLLNFLSDIEDRLLEMIFEMADIREQIEVVIGDADIS